MAKDPAFLFYYQDFIVGTTFMTFEEKGAYITLLCFLADKEGITKENILKIIPLTIWEAICCKFQNKDGLFFNKRLSDEIEKRQLYTASRRKNLHIDNHMGKHMKKHMENTPHMENENENKDKRVVKGDFIEVLKTNPAYSHININTELNKMDAWLLAHPGRQKTKRFIVNWLNKIERPLDIKKPIKPQPDYKAPDPKGKFKFIPNTHDIKKKLEGKQ